MVNSGSWRKDGDFHLEVNRSYPRNRSVQYTNHQEDQSIELIELYGFRGGEFRIRLTTRNSAAYEAIRQILNTHNAPNVDFTLQPVCCMNCCSENILDIKNFLNVLIPTYQELEEIKPEIFQYLDNAVLAASHSPVSTATRQPRVIHILEDLFRVSHTLTTPNVGIVTETNSNNRSLNEIIDNEINRETQRINTQMQRVIDQTFAEAVNSTPLNSPPPALGKNADRATALEIPDDGIPEEYLCALTCGIMTEPVSAPNLPPVNKPQILHALRIKQENPFNRTPLTEAQLIPETALQTKIENYLNEAESKKKERVTP